MAGCRDSAGSCFGMVRWWRSFLSGTTTPVRASTGVDFSSSQPAPTPEASGTRGFKSRNSGQQHRREREAGDVHGLEPWSMCRNNRLEKRLPPAQSGIDATEAVRARVRAEGVESVPVFRKLQVSVGHVGTRKASPRRAMASGSRCNAQSGRLAVLPGRDCGFGHPLCPELDAPCLARLGFGWSRPGIVSVQMLCSFRLPFTPLECWVLAFQVRRRGLRRVSVQVDTWARDSPLRGVTPKELQEEGSAYEILSLLSFTDNHTSRPVEIRKRYGEPTCGCT